MKFDREDPVSGKGRYIIRDIPKYRIIEFIRKLKISRFNSKFDTKQITEFLSGCDDSSIELFDLVFIEGRSQNQNRMKTVISGKEICTILRNKCTLNSQTDRLEVGQKGKLAGTSDGKAGITYFNGKTAEEIINKAMEDFREDYKIKNEGMEFDKNKNYPSDTWFKFVKDRKPLILIYMIEIGVDPEDPIQKKQIEKFRCQMGNIPAVGFALGLPRNDEQMKIATTRYKANKVYNWFERDEYIAEDDEE